MNLYRIRLLLCVGVLTGAGASAQPGAEVDGCTACHAQLDDEELVGPVGKMAQDIHARQGLSCADCHGGDPTTDDEEEAMDEDAGFVGVPDKVDMPEFCGKCHSDAAFVRQYNPSLRVDQVTLYWTSVHGQRLAGIGDEKVAACADCHGAHGILPAEDPRSPVYAANVPVTCTKCHADAAYMAEYDIPTDQYDKYSGSVHGRALLERRDMGAPACNDCHGNHGTAPPGVNSLANVCGQCHPINNELVSGSPHRPAFEKLGIAACKTCHRYHDIDTPGDFMVGTELPAVCVNCHGPDKRRQGWLGAGRIRAAIDNLVIMRDRADSLVRKAERAGMEVSDAKFNLNEAASRLTKIRSTLHSFDPDRVAAVSAEGMELAVKAYDEGVASLDELVYRRTGLAFSLGVIVILAGALFVKIRGLGE